MGGLVGPEVRLIEDGDSEMGQALRASQATGELLIGVLGPLTVTRAGIEIRALPEGQRTVLGLLALAGSGHVRRESIIDALWSGHPPQRAVGIVQTYISRLRSQLSPLRTHGYTGRVGHHGRGYWLQVADHELDLLAFRRLTETAREAASTGQSAEACDAYERALALWRGEPAENVEHLCGHPAIAALAEERITVAIEYAELAADKGWHAMVVPHLRALTARDPLDERLHACLIIALAGSGMQAEALRTYESLRRRLDDQLGVQPSPPLRAAHARVLRQEIPAGRPICRAPLSRTPHALGPRENEGPCYAPVYQLPGPPADYTGRARESVDLVSAMEPDRLLRGVPVVVVSGPPGVGKTSFALHTAHQLRSRFPDGQLWADLGGTSAQPLEPADVLRGFLRALGVPDSAMPDATAELAACYRSRLAGRKVLIFADDAASAAQVLPLVPGTIGSALLVTSRPRLESLVAANLMPLDVPPADDAVAMLCRMIGKDRVRAEGEAARTLVEACGRLPLAVRILGAKLAARPSWPVSFLAKRMAVDKDRLSLLENGGLSVGISIGLSCDGLSARARSAFPLLAVHPGPDFAEWVVSALLGERDATDVVTELVENSLLTPAEVDRTGEPRYRLHALVRAYAAERLCHAPAGVADAARMRVVAALRQLAGLADRRRAQPGGDAAGLAHWPGIVPADVADRLTADPAAWFAAESESLGAISPTAPGPERCPVPVPR